MAKMFKDMTDVVVVSGGFDPLHPGHVKMFHSAKKKGEFLVAGVNSDEWLTQKKGKPFMKFIDRCTIVGTNEYVDLALGFDDEDGTAINLLYKVSSFCPKATITFCNGGDRTNENVPEANHFFGDDRFKFDYEVGGSDKYSSSSDLLDEWVRFKCSTP